MIDIHKHHFYSGSAYTALDLWLVWLDTGHVGLAWRAASVTYAARWANPLWDFTAGVTAEHIRISEMLHQAIHATMDKPDLSVTRAAVGSAPVLVPPSILARSWKWGRRLIAWTWPRAGNGPPPTSSAAGSQSDAEPTDWDNDSEPDTATDSPNGDSVF